PEVGLPVTFTIRIRNDGAAELTRLPLEDTYDPAVLAFNYAVPTPTLVITATGVISWADLTAFFGPIPGDTTITVTVVFTALSDIETSVNQAQVVGARDEFGNDLAAGQDEVPIRILPLPLPTATPRPTPEEEEETPPTPTPTPTFTPIATPSPTATPTFPTTLPETGAASGEWPLIIGGMLLALSGSVLLKLRRSLPG
ncbi:MAG: LPXTG cell wall anchor domain-containing protein, partial [Anaerolineae bacterium]